MSAIEGGPDTLRDNFLARQRLFWAGTAIERRLTGVHSGQTAL